MRAQPASTGHQSNQGTGCDVVVLICARSEWRQVVRSFRQPACQRSPFGEYFSAQMKNKRVLLFQCGVGKVSAAAGTQYAIDHFHPNLVINLGTCGGMGAGVCRGEVILANETIIYDIIERMGDPDEALRDYSTRIDLDFLKTPFPIDVRVARILSADQDIDPNAIENLVTRFNTSVADWESGAIAWTASQNLKKVLILRGVSDLVETSGGEIYQSNVFQNRAAQVMIQLLDSLPSWLECVRWEMFE